MSALSAAERHTLDAVHDWNVETATGYPAVDALLQARTAALRADLAAAEKEARDWERRAYRWKDSSPAGRQTPATIAEHRRLDGNTCSVCGPLPLGGTWSGHLREVTVLTPDEMLAVSAVVHQDYYMPDVFAAVAKIAQHRVRGYAEREPARIVIEARGEAERVLELARQTDPPRYFCSTRACGGCAGCIHALAEHDRDRLSRVRVALDAHPAACDRHEPGEPVSCGWKRAVRDVSIALCDGSAFCEAPIHEHGCYADATGPCNAPEEHQ